MADFELDLSKRNIKCYLADYSVDSPPIHNSLFYFKKKFLGSENNSMYMTLTKWVNDNAESDDNDLILQMDIEGAEYDVLLETNQDLLKRFRILVIEFHNIDAILNPMGFKLINGVFTKLLNLFEIVHIHPNNCCSPIKYKKFVIPPTMEFTFLRKDRIVKSEPTKTFPHELDNTNLPTKNDFTLPNCWYRKD
ncbi:MAG: FkbM family methyltransferase [Nitrosarchaeum sp.]|nr:FkbM family methyltransferase [Nitrosarchaeum sp.]